MYVLRCTVSTPALSMPQPFKHLPTAHGLCCSVCQLPLQYEMKVVQPGRLYFLVTVCLADEPYALTKHPRLLHSSCALLHGPCA